MQIAISIPENIINAVLIGWSIGGMAAIIGIPIAYIIRTHKDRKSDKKENNHENLR